MLVDAGGKKHRHVNVLVDIDLTKLLLRRTKLRHKQSERWVEFRYEKSTFVLLLLRLCKT